VIGRTVSRLSRQPQCRPQLNPVFHVRFQALDTAEIEAVHRQVAHHPLGWERMGERLIATWNERNFAA
jgi:hypothetical protein